jgi:hypothetical protein
VRIGCSTREAEFHKQEVQMYRDALTALEHKEKPPNSNMRAPFTLAIVESYDPRKAVALMALQAE